MWLLAAVGGGLVVLTGLLPLDTAETTLTRLAPVLVFLVAVTVLAELCEASGVFEVAARGAARGARGRTVTLFLAVAAIATATTVVLSLDTTAVLLTPVVLTLCSQLELDPLPFAMATVWLANTASLLLPASNLTNLLAARRLDVTAGQFASGMWAPALAAALVTTALLVALFHRRLTGRYRVPAAAPVLDRPLLWWCAASCGLFVVMILAGVAVAVASVLCAAAALTAFALRDRGSLSWSMVPWRLVLLVASLFLLVDTGRRHGLDELVRGVSGNGTSTADLLRLAGTAAGGANLVNNLPAYLALEPVTDGSPARWCALLVGVNAGPLVLLWGSLATILWRDRCRARGVHVSAGRFTACGLVLVPLVLTVAVLTVRWT